MPDLNCPLCGLHVAAAASLAATQLGDCPRCLARTGGALSIKLEHGSTRANAPLQRRVASLLSRLRPVAVKR